MRHFIVLGFSSNSRMDSGESLYLGGDRGAAIAVVNEPDGRFARKAMHELAVPHISRHFKGDDQPEPQPAGPEMTDSARALADENDLTAEQIAEIKPTGKTGNILKEDVEDYLDPPGDE